MAQNVALQNKYCCFVSEYKVLAQEIIILNDLDYNQRSTYGGHKEDEEQRVPETVLNV